MHYAISTGSIDLVKLFLEYGSDCSSYLTGKNPIEIAAKYNHHYLIRLLVNYGGDVNDPGVSGNYPIVVAVKNNFIDCVKELLSSGADPHVRDTNGDTLVHKAVMLEDPLEMLRLLLKLGIDTTIKNIDSLTPLQLAYEKDARLALEALGGRLGLITDEELLHKKTMGILK